VRGRAAGQLARKDSTLFSVLTKTGGEMAVRAMEIVGEERDENRGQLHATGGAKEDPAVDRKIFFRRMI